MDKEETLQLLNLLDETGYNVVCNCISSNTKTGSCFFSLRLEHPRFQEVLDEHISITKHEEFQIIVD